MSRSMSLPLTSTLNPAFTLSSGLEEPSSPGLIRTESYSVVDSGVDVDHGVVHWESDTLKLSRGDSNIP